MIPSHSPWARLPTILITIAACLFTASVHAADKASSSSGADEVHPVADIKKAGKEIGHGVKKGAKAVGQGARKVTREIGHGFRDGAKAVGRGTAKAAKEVGKSIQDASTGDGKKD